MSVVASLRAAARPVLSPHEYGYRWRLTRKAYKAAAGWRQRPSIRRSTALLGDLPDASEIRVPRSDGFRSFPRGAFPVDVEPTLATARAIAAERAGAVEAKASKSWFRHLLRDGDLVSHPELIDLALDPLVVAMVADYLGELPVLSSVWMWQSVPVSDPLAGSQLLHADFDDTTQLKLFLHVEDVTATTGPLVGYRAEDSARAMASVRYVPGERGHLADADIVPHLGGARMVTFDGPAGTLDVVDTSRVLHRGSRDQVADRFVLGYQFVTHSSFLVNALRSRPSYPLEGLARPHDPALRLALLTGSR